MARMLLKPFNFYGICAFSTFFLMFFLAGTRYSGNVNYSNKPTAEYEVSPVIEVTTMRPLVLKPAVEVYQAAIERSMEDYEYPKGKYGVNATNLNDLIINTGGTPIRSVVLTTWRSGSTFLGEILNAVPGNFYHYEPLLEFGIIQIRGPPHAEMALKQLKKLLSCNYTDLNSYIQYGKAHVYQHTHNTRLWESCSAYTPNQCQNATFMTEFCRIFPFQSMKVVRLRLKLAEQLLKDESLKVRVVLLIRDPRAVLQSRLHRDWCPGLPDCIDPHLLCADMVSDYVAASEFLVKYPNTFKVLRYEDFALDTLKGSQELFEFLGRQFHPAVADFLKTHTRSNMGGVSSTYRLSKETPFHWKKDLPFDYVEVIQRACAEAMSYWGYNPARDPDHLLSPDFNPVGKYSMS